MQFSVYINQQKALEWGLNLSQTVLFSFLYEAPSWAQEVVVDGLAYYWIAKEKVSDELPILTDKPNTVRKLMVSLEDAGLISRTVVSNRTLVRITDEGKLWNKTGVGKKSPPKATKGSEKNPTQDGKKIPSKGGKKSPLGEEKNPPNHITISNNHDQPTNDHIATAQAKSKSGIDFSPWTDLGNIEPELLKDWETMRKKNKGVITQTVINQAAKEFSTLMSMTRTWTVSDCLTEWVVRGWRGFKAEWVLNSMSGTARGPNGSAPSPDNQSAIEAFATGALSEPNHHEGNLFDHE